MDSTTSHAPVLFFESQGFLRPWWWLLVLLAALSIGSVVLAGKGSHAPVHLSLGPLVALPVLLVVGLFALLRLDTRLDAQGIAYRMRPLRQTRLDWAQVRSARVRHYSPIGEYGGWGIRGLSSQNRALNVAGSHGL